TVQFQGSIERTLRSERILLGPYVTSLDKLICDLNLGRCPKGRLLNTSFSDGETIVLPDLPSESVLRLRRIKLDGRRTLGEEADLHVQSGGLLQWTTQDNLARMNPQYRHDLSQKPSIRDEREGTFNVPQELVHYI